MHNAVPMRAQLGEFELDLKAGELLKDGRRVLLQEQPFQILLMLAERSGEVVSRAEIKEKLWPNGTVVEFEHSISAAIKKLRRVLDDTVDNPKYVETVGEQIVMRGENSPANREYVIALNSDTSEASAYRYIFLVTAEP